MGIKAGLVGLPNVGKSTLFNALTKSSIPTENYPFCTINPHIAITEVPDERIPKLQQIYKSEKIIPSTVTFVDIAGLVKGAATGEGLGNQFLRHIREVDLILHVLRCFEDPNIIRTEAVDPISDYETIVAELMLKDLESIDKRIPKIEKSLKGQPKSAEKKALEEELQLIKQLREALDTGNSQQVKNIFAQATIQTIPLLTTKNFLIIANIAESELEHEAYLQNKHYQALIEKFGQSHVIPICARIEYELSQLPEAEAQELMVELGIKKYSLDAIISATYNHLTLITFFTCGPKEIHAWPIKHGITAKNAAGEIHSDLQRGFICAEVFNSSNLFTLGSQGAIKKAGKIRIEGAEYIVQDGDIMLIRFNV